MLLRGSTFEHLWKESQEEEGKEKGSAFGTATANTSSASAGTGAPSICTSSYDATYQ